MLFASIVDEVPPTALDSYREGFVNSNTHFIDYHTVKLDKSFSTVSYTRAEFWTLSSKFAALLRQDYGLNRNDAVVHLFNSNEIHDLSLRLASVMVGTIPVTINWQADTKERMLYKITKTSAKLVVLGRDYNEEVVDYLKSKTSELELDVAFVDLQTIDIEETPPLEESLFTPQTSNDSTRIIIFTSGTTGEPKGVKLSYNAYKTNRETFDGFLQTTSKGLIAVVTNPLHHTNSTSITDWALRKPNARLHLLARYTTLYWKLLYMIGMSLNPLDTVVVAPLVSVHIDFLDHLVQTESLPVEIEKLTPQLAKINLLIGSAPVGPTTVARLQKYASQLPPVVRFGSTETCLQVCGTLLSASSEVRLSAFKSGWNHTWKGQKLCGYYIGREHPNCTEVKIVLGGEEENFMQECEHGQPGQLVTRGGNLFSCYVGDEEATKKAMKGDWYVNCRDVCFKLLNEIDGGVDIFWLSRDSNLLIRGGANYSFEQINSELTAIVRKKWTLESVDVEVAVVGVRGRGRGKGKGKGRGSEHEDLCCVTLELKSDLGREKLGVAKESDFLSACKEGGVSKGSRPDRVVFGSTPKNFKGAIQCKDLLERWGAVFDAEQATG